LLTIGGGNFTVSSLFSVDSGCDVNTLLATGYDYSMGKKRKFHGFFQAHCS
jgi:hypothetical protein